MVKRTIGSPAQAMIYRQSALGGGGDYRPSKGPHTSTNPQHPAPQLDHRYVHDIHNEVITLGFERGQDVF